MTNHMNKAIEALQQMTLTGNRQLIPAQAKDCVEAALPHIRAMIAEEIRDYWEACGDLIDTHNGARLAFDAIAARIAKGPQQ